MTNLVVLDPDCGIPGSREVRMEPVALIRAWLGCSEEAGWLVWFQPTVLSNASVFDVYKAKALKTGREWMDRGLRI